MAPEPKRIVEVIDFGPLFNSQDPSQTPLGRCYASSNATFENGVVEGGPRYGRRWKRGGWNANDTGLGGVYAEYGTAKEFLAIIKKNGEAFGRLYSVSTAGVWTAVTNAGGAGNPDPQNLSISARYTFCQYEDRVYIAIDDGSQRILMRTVGAAAGTAPACAYFSPRYNRGAGFGVVLEQPPYNTVTFARVKLIDPGGRTIAVSKQGSATLEIDFTGAVVNGAFYLVLEFPDGLDMTYADHWHDQWTAAGANLVTPIVAAYAFTEDDKTDWDTDVNQAWCEKQNFMANGNPINTSGALWDNTYVTLSYLASPRANRKPIKRAVIKITTAAPNFNNGPAAGSYSLNLLELGGARIWDKTAPASGATIGYAARWVNRKGATATYTSLVQMPDVVINDGASHNDLLGQQPAGATRPFMGCLARVQIPYNATLLNQGYDWIEVFRQDDTNAAKWAKVGEVRHEKNDLGLLEVVDGTLQTVVDATSVVATPGQAGPNSSAAVIGIWKQHMVIADDRRLYFSFASLPDQFRPASGEVAGYYDTINDDDLGRTLFVSKGRVAHCKAIIGQDNCYIGTERDVEVTIGDTAETMSFPRAMAGSFRVLARRGHASWRSGALIAHDRGLWFYLVTRAYASSYDTGQEDPGEELTREIRSSWADLRGARGAPGETNLVVGSALDEIWVFAQPLARGNQGHFLRLTRPSVKGDQTDGIRAWEYGTFPEIVAVMTGEDFGMKAMTVDGSIIQVGWDEDGTKFDDDDGTPVNFSATTGLMVNGRFDIKSIYIEAVGQPSVTLSVWDGLNTAGTPEVTTFTPDPDQNWIEDVNVRAGSVFQFEVSGVCGEDMVRQLVIKKEPLGEAYGN